MPKQPLAQYYLNAMGLPFWCLKASSIEQELPLIPAGLVAFDCELKYEPKVEVEAEIVSTDYDSENPDPNFKNPQAVNAYPQQAHIKTTNTINRIAENTVIEQNSYQQGEIQEFELLSKQISSCQLCKNRKVGELSLGIKQLKSASTGSKTLLLLVETPSTIEYQQNTYINNEYKPLLLAIFQALNLDANIYISCLLKCSGPEPYQRDNLPENRQQKSTEIENCLVFLKQEIRLVKPDLIVPLSLMDLDQLVDSSETVDSLAKNIGQKFTLKESLAEEKVIHLIPTFHPAFLFRHPLFKAKALQNWITISKLLK